MKDKFVLRREQGCTLIINSQGVSYAFSTPRGQAFQLNDMLKELEEGDEIVIEAERKPKKEIFVDGHKYRLVE